MFLDRRKEARIDELIEGSKEENVSSEERVEERRIQWEKELKKINGFEWKTMREIRIDR